MNGEERMRRDKIKKTLNGKERKKMKFSGQRRKERDIMKFYLEKNKM